MIYWSRICHSPKTMLGTYVKGCGRSDRVISEFYLKDIFVTLFKNDVLCQKLGKEFNPSPLGYACNSKFFREKSVFSWSWKKAECLLLETGTVCPNIGLPRWLSGKESACQWGRHKFDPWVRKIPWRWKWQFTPVFSPGKFRGQRSLAGYRPWARKEVDRPECHVNTNTHRIFAGGCPVG